MNTREFGREPEFTPITSHEPGALYALLERNYAEVLSADPERWEPVRLEWLEFDTDAFGNPAIGACVFVTVMDGEAIGFGCFDPRQAPEVGVIGHNCIVPEFRGRGFGKRQMEEILRRFRERGIRKAVVSTGAEPFFAAARAMYISCGFVETGRAVDGDVPGHRLIEYARDV